MAGDTANLKLTARNEQTINKRRIEILGTTFENQNETI